MKHWPTWRCTECLNIHCSLGEIVSDIGARAILGELLYPNLELIITPILCSQYG